ncbi:hypothetical protein Tco_1345874 [Tanacetum coccineum]
MELVMEQTQQGTSYEVSVSAEGVEELKRKLKINGEKKEALLTLRQKLERFDTSARNPVKQILLKLNLPDHRSILTDSKILKDGHGVKEFQRSFRHSDTERLSRSDEVLKLKNFKKDATLKLPSQQIKNGLTLQEHVAEILGKRGMVIATTAKGNATCPIVHQQREKGTSTQTVILIICLLHQAVDLDAYDSDFDELKLAKVALMRIYLIMNSVISSKPTLFIRPTIVEVPKDFLKVNMVNTRVKQSTSASGSQPSGNTKKDKIHQTPSSTLKNKVEAYPRKVKSSLKNKDCVCNGCMLSDNHDLCVHDFINNVNAHAKSRSVKKNSKRKVWKPTGKVFTNIGYIWRPTGRTFTIVGNACPLTRITTTTEVPLRKPITLDNDTPKPSATLVYSRKPRKSKTNVPVSNPKIL